eukprot:Skav206822  [mRNA]  locus=scaffold3672:30536:33409:+ [translate_table: standard]
MATSNGKTGSFAAILTVRQDTQEANNLRSVAAREPLGAADSQALPASYVKFIESAGGEVVSFPQLTTGCLCRLNLGSLQGLSASTRRTLRRAEQGDPGRGTLLRGGSLRQMEILLDSLNGFLFTGGADMDPPPAAQRVLQRSKELFKAGDPKNQLPVWGTCLGFEWLVSATSPPSLISGFRANNVNLPLQLSPEAGTSRLFGKAPQHILDALQFKNVSFNSHHRGVRPATRPVNCWTHGSPGTDRQAMIFYG